MSLHVWLTSSLVRHFPQTPAQRGEPLILQGARNEQMSFQVALRLEEEERCVVRLAVDGPPGWSIRVRRVGYVPVRHHNTPIDEDTDALDEIPGYVPDPLFDEHEMLLPQGETHAFWVTVVPGTSFDTVEEAAPGTYDLQVRVIPEQGAPISRVATVRLYDVFLKPREGFHVTHWFYADALIDWYRTDLFDQRFWQILPAYVEDVVAHGQDTLYVPVFTPPLDGVKRPSQLLDVQQTESGVYAFGWGDVKRYVDVAKAAGVSHFEWTHFFTQWGAKHAIRIYEGQGREERLLWAPETGATSETYRAFLAQFLAAFHRFLEEEGLFARSLFHASDEPHSEEHLAQYQANRALLRELAPWMSVMDALSEIEFGREGAMDMPIPSISTALDFHAEGIASWCYYCCGPRGRYLNRLLDTPLPKIAMHGMLFYRWPFKGFLHWGYNYWYQSQTRNLIDPYTVQDGLTWQRGWAYGDPFMVYPGPAGPVDSLRWEVFAESLQDYRLLQTLGIDRDDEMLADLRSFEDFPKAATWRADVRRRLLEGEGNA